MAEKELEALFRQLSPEEAEKISATDVDFSADETFADRIYLLTMKKAGKKGESQMIKKIKSKKRFAVLLVAAVLLLVFATGTAAYTYFHYPDQQKLRAEIDFDTTNISRVVDLASAEPGDIIVQNKQVKVDGYTVTFEAIVRANTIREIMDVDSDENIVSAYADGTFALVTISRDDGGPIWYDNGWEDERTLNGGLIGGAPLIHGVIPNMSTYVTSFQKKDYVEDNVLYVFIDITDVMCFADHGLSLAIYGKMVFSSEEINLDANGVPYFTETAPVLHAMFDLPIDQSYADAEQQEIFISQRLFRWAE